MEKRKVAVIGAGISGLSIAHFLKEKNEVVVFEKENRPGGLIKCKNIDGNVYHLVGGHVFNSKRLDVLDWFWSFFDKGKSVFYIGNFLFTNTGCLVRINCVITITSQNNIYTVFFQ